jgi:hypothetical protein
MSLFDILAECEIFIWHTTHRVSNFHVSPVSKSICEVISVSVFRTLDTFVNRVIVVVWNVLFIGLGLESE